MLHYEGLRIQYRLHHLKVKLQNETFEMYKSYAVCLHGTVDKKRCILVNSKWCVDFHHHWVNNYIFHKGLCLCQCGSIKREWEDVLYRCLEILFLFYSVKHFDLYLMLKSA